MITLVMGLPGVGKTTYVKRNIGAGLCYDLDYLSSALRLDAAKQGDTYESRMAANAMLQWFLCNAESFAEECFVIRTAPTPEEVREIRPQRVVIVKRRNAPPSHNEYALICRIVTAELALRDAGIPVETIMN